MPTLHSTYRLQLTPTFGFAEARAILLYLQTLGISHAYLSPIAEARAGSTHGYDATDPTRIRAELGGEPEFRLLAETARRLGMGIILDIVPNHVAADPTNPWWADVLTHGQDSSFADFFDIDWNAGDGKLILPVLGQPLTQVILAGELTLDSSPATHLRYFDRRFPVAPGTADSSAETTLARQHYRLEYWRTGAASVNYRRFFDIHDLAALRMEVLRAFDAVHALPLRLLAGGLIDGVRVDHVDGLADPTAYLRALRDRLDLAAPSDTRPILLVEKILAEDESLHPDWPIDGSTGYEFLKRVNALFVDPEGCHRIEAGARAAGAIDASFDNTARKCKREAARALFIPDLKKLEALCFRAFDAADVRPQDRPSSEELRESLIEVSAALDVYRTYIDRLPISAGDLARIDRAIAAASRAPHPVVATLLRAKPPFNATPRAAAATLAALIRWQQLTGPLAAKGIEDTALYRHITLASLNEVGGPSPVHADVVSQFHAHMHRRVGSRALNATSTHDTKRAEDTRLRISSLSEMSAEWLVALARWREWHQAYREHDAAGPIPSFADESLCYQSLLAIWPSSEPPALADIENRLAEYLVKAAREAKLRTSWLDPNSNYESGLRKFVRALVTDAEGARFREDSRSLRSAAAFYAAVHSLSQTVIKTLAPGIPDFYQGAETWDTSLVDPDNRRPVDYAGLQRTLTHGAASALPIPPATLDQLLASWRTGQVKQIVTRVALHARSLLLPDPAGALYTPLPAEGTSARHVLAFARTTPSATVIILVPRLVASLAPPGRLPLGGDAWGDTRLSLPPSLPPTLVNLFGGDVLPRTSAPTPLYVRDALFRFPVAILTAATG